MQMLQIEMHVNSYEYKDSIITKHDLTSYGTMLFHCHCYTFLVFIDIFNPCFSELSV